MARCKRTNEKIASEHLNINQDELAPLSQLIKCAIIPGGKTTGNRWGFDKFLTSPPVMGVVRQTVTLSMSTGKRESGRDVGECEKMTRAERGKSCYSHLNGGERVDAPNLTLFCFFLVI
ncbi:hypothetical protein GWI33_011415 [Rhynchophorus ferrugineus]|uniref:Uncharacterized protein n=1 Tax=Rhynchophorus ferrugineus TaxID=354439 RepID=A0A834MK26_RHYFE|nr:hypothetical protein GWI33_011415 [Rhynchophorus ferrugineus]